MITCCGIRANRAATILLLLSASAAAYAFNAPQLAKLQQHQPRITKDWGRSHSSRRRSTTSSSSSSLDDAGRNSDDTISRGSGPTATGTALTEATTTVARRENAGIPRRLPSLMETAQQELLRQQQEGGRERRKENGKRLRERNLSIKQEMESKDLTPLKVIASPELRARLRLKGREKRSRVFVSQEDLQREEGLLETISEAITEAFPLKGLPFVLSVKTDREGDKARLTDDAGMREALHWAETEGKDLYIFLDIHPDIPEDEVPPYLQNLPDVEDPDQWQMISFYRFVPIDDPETFSLMLQMLWRPLGVFGRVYVAHEGINAQMSVPLQVMDHFKLAVDSVEKLQGVYINKDTEVWSRDKFNSRRPFSNLHVRMRHQIVSDGLDPVTTALQFDSNIGEGMEPDAWHEMVDRDDTVVLDCRNTYETDVGIFDTAVPLDTSFFRESWDSLRQSLRDTPKDRPVLTYCTGGIRCVKIAAYLEQEMGFTNVKRLNGGIIKYARYVSKLQEEGGTTSKFKGKNYVFDNRMGERITQDVLSNCDQCGTPNDDHVNCRNERCHVRFIQCSACGQKYDGCCSKGCQIMRAAVAAGDTAASGAAAGAAPATGGGLSPGGVFTAPSTTRATLTPNIANVVQPISAGTAATATTDTPPHSSEDAQLQQQQQQEQLVIQQQEQWEVVPQRFQNAGLNRKMDELMERYASDKSSEEPALLARLRKETSEEYSSAAHMLAGHLQGRLLTLLTKLLGAQRVLEIGCFTGYSALCFAEGLSSTTTSTTEGLDSLAGTSGQRKHERRDQQVVTCEIDPRSAAFAQRFFDESEYGGRIRVELGPAMDTLQGMVEGGEQPFDIVFIDGDKRMYRTYYDTIMDNRLLSKKGLLLVDNVMFHGEVLEVEHERSEEASQIGSSSSSSSSSGEALSEVGGLEVEGVSAATTVASAAATTTTVASAAAVGAEAGAGGGGGGKEDKILAKRVKRRRRIAESLADFNDHINADPRVEIVVLPLRDGLTLVRWKG